MNQKRIKVRGCVTPSEDGEYEIDNGETYYLKKGQWFLDQSCKKPIINFNFKYII